MKKAIAIPPDDGMICSECGEEANDCDWCCGSFSEEDEIYCDCTADGSTHICKECKIAARAKKKVKP